jgi:nifR3 family TIM-barrel protein
MAVFEAGQLEGKAVLAPMAGITDSPFRLLCRRQGAAMVYTEMLSAEGLARGHGQTWRMAGFLEEERPLALQLFGSRPEAFARAVSAFDETGPDFFDLNFGCPAPKVVRSGGGSSLLRDPKAVEAIARAVVKATDRPVLAKIRSGWEVGAENAVEVARILEGCGVAAIAVHGRTRGQMFSGQADWTIIARVREKVSIPVIGNGDVRSGPDARRMLAETGCQLVMVGRAAQGAPWIFSEINAWLAGENPPAEAASPDWLQRKEVIKEHLRLMIETKGEARGVLEMRKHLGWYIKGIPGAAKMRQELMKAETMSQVEVMLEALEETAARCRESLPSI